MNKTNTDEKALYIIGWVLLGIAAVFAVSMKLWPQLYLRFMTACPFHEITGLECPGCGGTRAVMALAKGEVLTSFLYHPFVLYVVILGGWFMISHTIQLLSKGKLAIGMKYRDIYLWIALAIVILNFVVKNIMLFCGIDLLYSLP